MADALSYYFPDADLVIAYVSGLLEPFAPVLKVLKFVSCAPMDLVAWLHPLAGKMLPLLSLSILIVVVWTLGLASLYT